LDLETPQFEDFLRKLTFSLNLSAFCFGFDSRGFMDAKHYSKGLFGACTHFGAEIRIFIAQKGLWGPAI
jgi:hypothetical protein